MKLLEITADAGSAKTMSAIAQKHKAYDFQLGFTGADGRQTMPLLLSDNKAQAVLDTIQSVLGAQPYARILMVPLEVVLPKPPEDERAGAASAIASREALYAGVEKSVRLDVNYLILVALSTVVAGIGLIENNVAVVIGAMVIAPLLGPNLALGFATALGDIPLIKQSLKTNIAGIGLAIALSIGMGFMVPFQYDGAELMSRTKVGFDSLILAMASGAAATLSLTTGLSSVLVGVMVAVALLPPAVTCGLMLGDGRFELASGAALLLAVNVVSLNLTSKIVFMAKGTRPRTWWEKEKAGRTTKVYLLAWLATLGAVVMLIYLRRLL